MPDPLPPAENDAPSVEVLREAARLMREEHGPEHERHAMWAAMAHLLEREADIEEELSASLIASTAVARAYLDAPRTRPIPPGQGSAT